MSLQADVVTTATQVLDIAQELVQTRGFNEFSYSQVAGELGITKAALHYHFPTKAGLGEALIDRYSDRFFAALDALGVEQATARGRLEGYVDLYRSVLSTGRACLCGMLAAEYQTLPPGMRALVLSFFDRNERWLESVLESGIAGGELTVSGQLRDVARVIIDTLEGAMMISRAHDDTDRFDRVASRMLATILSD
jgi:TetR/AcrR family transcriptional repressor of nem operon